MRGGATELVTYKCGGCGTRYRDGTQWGGEANEKRIWAVCSRACYETAYRQFQRQRVQALLRRLLGDADGRA